MEKSKKDNFILFILILLMIIIFVITIYFILDVFGIIKVPNKYSIASLFYSQIEVIATGGEHLTDEIKPSLNKTKDNNKKNNYSKAPEVETNEEIDISNVQNPIEELNRLKNELNANNQVTDNQEDQTSIEVNNFYYNQLDEYGKIIYDKLYKNLDKLKTGTYTADFDTTFDDLLHQENGSDILNNSFQLAINALTFDNPDLFYIDITKINLVTKITTRAFSTTYRISIGGNGKSYLSDEFDGLSKVNSEIANIENIKKDILLKTGSDKVENLKIVHDYLIDSIEYDVEAGKNVYNVYGALVDKKAVCEGYARTYKLLLDEIGIPCIIACGTGTNRTGETESHAWNYVQIDNTWYAIDVTWDDPVIIGNGTLTDSLKYRYFLLGSDEFFKDHYEDGNIAAGFNFKYPVLSSTNY